MARDLNGTTDRMDYAAPTAIASGSPWTIGAWAFFDTLSGTAYILNAGFNNGIGTVFYGTFSGTALAIWHSNTAGGAYSTAVANGGVVTGEWHHYLMTWDGTGGGTGMALYRDGSSLTISTSSGSGTQRSTNDDWCLGGRQADDARNLDGKIADPAVWNRVLSAEEIAALGKGLSPWFIRRGLLFAPSLLNDPRDPISGAVPTLDGTTVFAHPRMVYPRAPRLVLPAGAGAAPIPSGGGSVSAVGSLVGAGYRQSRGSGAVIGVGEASAGGQHVATGSGSFEAIGVLVGAGYHVATGSGSFEAIGLIEGAGSHVASGSGSFEAIGVLVGIGAAPPDAIPSGGGSVSAVGSLVGGGYRTSTGAGSFEAIGLLDGAGYRASAGSGSFEAIGILVGIGLTPDAEVGGLPYPNLPTPDSGLDKIGSPSSTLSRIPSSTGNLSRL